MTTHTQAQNQAAKSLEQGTGPTRGQWLVLVAAFLGWMFDGLEMGMFPVVARPALQTLLGTQADQQVGPWMGYITALFLLGAASGGLVFGWLGDKVGRVRAMTASILVYSLFTGTCAFATAAWQLGLFRFIAALGMGGEWALGVALVMECWPENKRPLLAGAIGAASNCGYALIGLVTWQFPVRPDSWRWVLLCGAVPALLGLFISFWVPESKRWKQAVAKEPVKQTAQPISLIVLRLVGAGAVTWIIASGYELLALLVTQGFANVNLDIAARDAFLAVGWVKSIATIIFAGIYAFSASTQSVREVFSPELRGRTILAICFSSVALIGTWGSVQWLPLWADKMIGVDFPAVKGLTMLVLSVGAIIGSFLGPLIGAITGRRLAYFGLCVASLLSCGILFRTIHEYGFAFQAGAFVAGMTTAAFYGWLPLYLPELFPTRARATGQGLSYNAGRVLAAVGALTQGALVRHYDGSYAKAGAVVTLIYLVGMVLIWFARETKGQPLPE